MKIIYREKEFDSLIKKVNKKKIFAPVYAWYPELNMGGIAISIGDKGSYYVPLFHSEIHPIDALHVFSGLFSSFNNKKNQAVFYDSIRDVYSFRNDGLKGEFQVRDVRILASLLEEPDSENFGVLTSKNFQGEDLGLLKEDFEKEPSVDTLGKYLCTHVEYVFGLYEKMLPMLSNKVGRIYSTYMRLVNLLVDMRFHGVKIDKKSCDNQNILDSIDSAGFVHSTFNLHPSSGKISAFDPNIQSIPSKSKIMFVAPEDYELVSMDYSQMGLRMVAYLSEDDSLCTAFDEGKDIHSLTASILFQKEEITEQERQVGKRVNFGIVYGVSPQSLESTVKEECDRKIDGKKFIDDFFDYYKSIKELQEDIRNTVEEEGCIQTALGKTKTFGRLSSDTYRQALNFVIQGLAADIFIRGLVRVDKFFRQREAKSRIALLIHDEIMFYWHKDEMGMVKEVVELLENEPMMPLKVGVEHVC